MENQNNSSLNSLDNKIQEKDFQDLLQRNHQIVDTRVTGLLQQNFTLVEKFFTKRDLAKLVSNANLQEAKTEVDFRHNLLSLSADFKLQALTEKYDNWLKVIKVEYRQQFTAFVTDRQEKLRKTIYEQRAVFLSDIRREYETLEKNKDLPAVYAPLKAQIELETSEYFTWLNSLMKNFMDITEQKISDYNKE